MTWKLPHGPSSIEKIHQKRPPLSLERKNALDCWIRFWRAEIHSTHRNTQDVNSKLNLRDLYRFRLQFIFIRLSIFNEVISFSINHILYFQSNFPLVYLYDLFFCAVRCSVSLRWIQSNYLSLFSICVYDCRDFFHLQGIYLPFLFSPFFHFLNRSYR